MYLLAQNDVTVISFIFLLISPLAPVAASTKDGDKDSAGFLQQVCDKLGLNEDQCCSLSKTTEFIGYASVAAAVGTVGVPALLTYMGFSATGITAGSWAAYYQATYGIGTAFSWLQSVSMTGAAATAAAKVGVVAAAVKSYFFSEDCQKRSTNDNCAKK